VGDVSFKSNVETFGLSDVKSKMRKYCLEKGVSELTLLVTRPGNEPKVLVKSKNWGEASEQYLIPRIESEGGEGR